MAGLASSLLVHAYICGPLLSLWRVNNVFFSGNLRNMAGTRGIQRHLTVERERRWLIQDAEPQNEN